jgi:hypothetical protein
MLAKGETLIVAAPQVTSAVAPATSAVAHARRFESLRTDIVRCIVVGILVPANV